ncbi:MAG: MFS transporter [Oligoflexia bacterium]|nr:MFS transporter [Oligoflexia bacterium]
MREMLLIFTNFRMFLMLLLGFSSGLPIALAISTLQAWVASEGLDIKTIGYFSLVQLPYQLKFIWSPFMDRIVPPFLGRRRGWMLITQTALIVVIIAMGFCDPKTSLQPLAVLAVCLSFFSASQDIVIDAYRAEILAANERGSGAAISVLGYRLAMLTSGALALILADHLPWRWVYGIMACALLIGVLATLIAPAPTDDALTPKSLREAVVRPFVEFFSRPFAYEAFAFVFIYKIADVLALALSTKFMLELGFSKTDLGLVYKGVGLVATLVGALAGAALMAKMSLKRSLIWFGIAQAMAVLCFAMLAAAGKDYSVLSFAVIMENFTSGLGTAAFTALLMGLCDPRFTATQYALLSAFSSLPRVLAGPIAASLVVWLGWVQFFVLAALCAIPGLLMLRRYERWAPK